ncbi:MAG TPA: tetratricopeptide repeat protein [Polyangiaceae bacterium]|nr:tetratricopeptide repeat protein [Polyangiaceae bacterium]
MDLAQRLENLEGNRDWQGLVEELEKGVSAVPDAAQKASYHLRLGRLLSQKFFQAARALVHFQEAFKQSPQLVEALTEARGIYWLLGKLNMVQRLLEREIKLAGDAPPAAGLFFELGNVLADAGEYERASAAYERALLASKGGLAEAGESLEDLKADADSWQPRVATLLQEVSAGGGVGAAAASALLRAARLVRRYAPDEYEPLLARAYAADPSSREAAALYEGLLMEGGRGEELAAQQGRIVDGLDGPARASAAFHFGMRWSMRYQNVEQATRFFEQAFLADPSEPAFNFLREVYGTRDGNWERVAGLAESGARRSADGAAVFFHAQAGNVLWLKVGNLIRARQAFVDLAKLSPEHPMVRAFELQIGEPIVPANEPSPAPPLAARPERGASSPPPPLAARPERGASSPPPRLPSSPPPALEQTLPAGSVPSPRAELYAESPAPPAAAYEQPGSVPPPTVASVRPAEDVAVEVEVPVDRPTMPPAPEAAAAAAEESQIAELRALAIKQESAKRYNEYVKTLVQLASLLPDRDEKVETLLKAADLYVTKFANQTEAVKAYEQVLELDPVHESAFEFLRQAYEKRRDWEKLLGLQRREAERLEPGPERARRFLEMARLASERVKKPDVTVELWRTVLDEQPDNAEALGQLGALYERSKDYAALVTVLERQAEVTYDAGQKVQLLAKLGTYYGDRLNDDEGATRAWRQLLALDPNDRRAQEALKKKYLALGRWDDLEVFYAESGKWDEFIRVLESQEARETDSAAKVGLLMKSAQLWADKKSKLDRAAKNYEKVLELDPQNLAAAEALVPIYTQAQNARGLAAAIEVKLAHEADREQRLALVREVAVLYEGRLRDQSRAFDRYAAALELAPGDERSGKDVERLGKLTGRWEEVIAAYGRAIEGAEASGEGALVPALRLRLGRVLEQEVGRVDDALTQFRAVYDADGENAEAIAALERLYRQTARYQDLMQVYERKRELATTWDERRATLAAMASLYEGELADYERAIETYRTVLEEEPANPDALRALDALYSRLERWAPLADALRRRIDLETEEPSLIDLKFRLGYTLEHHLDDAAGALENYRELLFLDQGHEGSRLALESLLKHAELGPQAAAILEPIYELRGDWPRLIEVLDVLARHEDDPPKRVALWRKVARTAAVELNDVNAAFDASARALRDDPADAQARAELEEYAERADAWDKLDGVLREVAANLADARLARDYWLRLAHIAERLGKVDEAASGYDKILGLDPGDSEALSALDALYRRTERWEDLVSVYRRRIDLAADPAAREGLYGQMARVYEERLGRPDQAIAAYREVLAADPTSLVALQALDALFSRQSLWSDLADNLEAQLGLAETDHERLALMLRLADLRETRMGETEQAIEIYRQVLERSPENPEALAALERLGKEEKHELVVADILEPLYRRSGDFQKLIGVYEVQVRRSDDPGRRVELLHQVAQLYEDGSGDLNASFDTLARALAIDPTHEATQQGLDRLARATNRFQDLARVFQDLAERQDDPQVACMLYTASARVYEHDLGDLTSAVAHYRKVLSIDPTSLDAATSLERLFQQSERYGDLSLILQRKAEILDDVNDKKAALFQAAGIEEDVLERHEAAIGVYQKVLDVDPEDGQAIDRLIQLYLQLSRWEELLSTYQRKVDLVTDPEEKKGIFYQVGAVFERELSDVGRAIDTYQRVLELDPNDLAALGRLDTLYQESKNWPELLAVLQHEADLTAEPEEQISFQYRIAELYERHLGEVARAVDLYREILERSPDHAPTLEALEGLTRGEAEPLAAALVLEPVYEASGDYPKLVRVLEVQVRHADDPFKKVDLLHRVARLQEDSLGDARAAFDTYARALPVDNTNDETLAALERLATAVDRWPAVAALYDEELGRLADRPERLIELTLRVAQIYEVQLEDVDAAVARYRRVLEVDPENQSAVRSLDRLFTEAGRWRELAEVLAREAELGQSEGEVLEFKYRLGMLQQTRLDDVASAINAYREILNAAPDHGPALEALEGLFAQGVRQLEIAETLEPLYQSAGEWQKLAGVFEAQLAHASAPPDRLAAYYRLGELYEERLADPSAALDVYLRALREQPLDERSGEESERLARASDGGWERLANAYADVSGESEDLAVKRVLGKRLARVFEEELDDVTNAEETYRYVLSADPLEPESLANLDRICLSLGKWADLAAVLEQRVQVPGQEPVDLVDLYARLGEVYEARLDQVDDAIRAYRRIFDELDRLHEGAVLALGRLYARKGDWPALLTVYERELELAVGDAQEADIRAKIAHLLGDQLGDPERAIDAWKRVLGLRGEDPEALAALASLYERGSLWPELTDVLERQEAIAESDEERVRTLTKRARTFTEKLGRDEEALGDWNRVLDVEPSNLEALRAMADIRRRQKDAYELVAALHLTVERASGLLTAEELKETFRELGKTYGEVLEQPFDAADAWVKLLEIDPRDFEAMDALEDIYRKEERWTDVIHVKMGRASALAEPAEKVREYLEVAGLWEHAAGDRDGGRDAFERILEVEPAHDQAFFALEELHAAAGRWEPLIELYLARLETREGPAEKSDLLRRIARVFDEELDDKGQAFDALVTAFEGDYSDDETVRYLERMAQATGRWGELIQNANTWLQAETEAPKRITLSLRLAKWYGEDLGHPEYAQPYFLQVAQLDPNNVAVRRQAANLFRKLGQWQEAGNILREALDRAVTNKDKKEINTELGDLVSEHVKGGGDQAFSYYQRALDVDPHFVPALEALERYYTERNQHADLVRVLGQKVPALEEPSEIAATKLRMGRLYEGPLAKPESAVQVYREALEVDPVNLEAMRGLERAYGTLNRWPDLAAVLESQLDVVTTERDRIDVLFKLAKLQEEQFYKPDLQAARLEQILEIDPNHEPALEGLERAYRRLRQWPELINTFERHVAASSERAKKIDLYGKIAITQVDELDDVDRAIDAYKNIIDLDDAHIPALEALSKLYERQGDAAAAIDHMTRVADLTADGRQRVEMYYRIGKALDERLGDRVQAQERYEMALDLEPAHLPTLAALRQIAIDACDWDRAVRYLDQEQLHTPAPRQRARLLVELGKLRDEMLGEHAEAIQAYELALQSDADSEEAAMPLLDEYVRVERWAEAEPLAELLVKKSQKRDRTEQHRLQKTLARVTAAQGKDERALRAYQDALKLDLTDQETIRGLAEVNFRLKDWAGATANFQKVLTALGEDEVEERAEVYYKLGRIKREQNQAKQAIHNFEKALALTPGHRPTLEALVEVYTDLRDWKQVAAHKRQILDNVLEGDERYKLLLELADLWKDKENNPGKSIDALEEARDIRPDDHALLHKLLMLYPQTENWAKMIDTVQALAELETQPERKSKYIYTLAQLYRDKENDLNRAVDLFNEALDLNPNLLEAFERINKILTSQKNWKQLERAYRKMLFRVKDLGNAELEYNLCHSLGIIYRDRLQDPVQAIEAFKLAKERKPAETIENQILSELYELIERFDAAADEQHEILVKDPMRVEPYRALFRLYQRQHAVDEAWCLSAALVFLRKANEEESQFFETYRPQGILPFKSQLAEEHWYRYLIHENVNLYIGRIFQSMAPSALVAKAEELQRQNKPSPLEPRFRQDLVNSTVTFTKTFARTAQVLGIVDVPDLYVRSDMGGGLGTVPAQRPAVLAGQSVLTGFTVPDLFFICGKYLTLFRGEFFIKTLFATQTELEVLLYTGIKIARPDFPLPADKQAQVTGVGQAIGKRMQPLHFEALRQAVKGFFEQGGKVNLKRWLQGVDATASRAGLVLSADLEVAKKILGSEPQMPGDLPPADKLKELLVFSVSKKYFALRKTLGIAAGGG